MGKLRYGTVTGFACIGVLLLAACGHEGQDEMGWARAALERNKRFLRREIARRINLKFAPDIRFRIDERFDEADRIDKLLRTPAVQRDLDNKPEDDA